MRFGGLRRFRIGFGRSALARSGLGLPEGSDRPHPSAKSRPVATELAAVSAAPGELFQASRWPSLAMRMCARAQSAWVDASPPPAPLSNVGGTSLGQFGRRRPLIVFCRVRYGSKNINNFTPRNRLSSSGLISHMQTSGSMQENRVANIQSAEFCLPRGKQIWGWQVSARMRAAVAILIICGC